MTRLPYPVILDNDVLTLLLLIQQPRVNNKVIGRRQAEGTFEAPIQEVELHHLGPQPAVKCVIW